MPNTRVPLPCLTAAAYTSEADQIALENLQKVPLLPLLVRKFNELAVEELLYAQYTAQSVRCGPNQFHTLHGLLREACANLGVPEPELYLRYHPVSNAFTSGVHRPLIVVHSALVEQFTDEQLLFVLAHEVGHIQCGHVLYRMIGQLLLVLLDELGGMAMGVGRIATIGAVSAFYEWMRQSEFSTDRAGLLGCQDPDVALSAIMKLGCGSTRFDSEMSLDAFLEQARDHAAAGGSRGVAKALLLLLYNWQLTHPFVVFRAKGLDEWVRSGAYERILSGDYTPAREMPNDDHLPVDRPLGRTGAPEWVESARDGVRDLVRKGRDALAGPACPDCGGPLPRGAVRCIECEAGVRSDDILSPMPRSGEPIYDITLTAAGSDPAGLAAALCEVLSMAPEEAEEKVRTVPALLRRRVPASRVDAICTAIESAGGRVQVSV